MGNDGLSAFTEAEGFFLVNAFPLLQYLPSWFPGTGFKKIASDGYKKSMDALRVPHKLAKEEYVSKLPVILAIKTTHLWRPYS